MNHEGPGNRPFFLGIKIMIVQMIAAAGTLDLENMA
jgi:hypothetical protein